MRAAVANQRRPRALLSRVLVAVAVECQEGGRAVKAKEYIEDYRAATADGTDGRVALARMFLGLNKEALALAMQRSGVPKPPDRVLIPLLREFDLKWRAIARELDFNPNGWRDYWADREIAW